MTENKRYINDVNEIYDTWLGHMGNAPPTEWEIKEKEYFLVGVTHHQEDAEDICKVLNELAEENKELKSKYSEQCIQLDFLKDENQHMRNLVNENRQLKETNQELYDFRLVLNALLFNEWAETGKYEVYKSKRHHDGEPCFDGEWFIVVAILPSGQVTNHYHIKYWDYFKIPSYERVKDEFDGHTSSVVLLRYGVLLE